MLYGGVGSGWSSSRRELPLLIKEDNYGELSCRHIHAFVHSLLGTGGSRGGH